MLTSSESVCIRAKFLLVVGSGLHRQAGIGQRSALFSWAALLRKIASKNGLSLTKSEMGNPTIAWESMVLKLVCIGRSRKTAHQVEQVLRKCACELIKDAQGKAIRKGKENKTYEAVRQLLRGGRGHLLSLNFDQLAYCDSRAGKVGRRWQSASGGVAGHSNLRCHDWELLYRRVVFQGERQSRSYVWHPHGCRVLAKSLRLGFRDYGIMPSCYAEAFGHFKQWEKQCLKVAGMVESEKMEVKYQLLLCELAKMDARAQDKKLHPADNWVTRFMLLPVRFIGVGLGSEESGLRWLLLQRARNLARYHQINRPIVHRISRKAAPPFGVKEVYHDTADEAWSLALRP
ncbi:MAG: hypothetical protein WCO57_15720 [Verrucomicrobiota bacterium]